MHGQPGGGARAERSGAATLRAPQLRPASEDEIWAPAGAASTSRRASLATKAKGPKNPPRFLLKAAHFFGRQGFVRPQGRARASARLPSPGFTAPGAC